MKKIVLAYIPALHKGYINFLKENSYPLYIFSEKIVDFLSKKKGYYGRDIRALESNEVKKTIESLEITPSVSILDEKIIKEIKEKKPEIIVPDEDIIEDFFSKFLPNLEPKKKSVFLRWNKKITEIEKEIPEGRTVSENELDKEFLEKASEEAKKSSDWWRQIGSVLVKDGKIVLKSYNKHLPDNQNPNILGDPRSNYDAGEKIELCTAIHSEASLIAKAAKEGISLKGSYLYVTTFPCPNCAKLIAESGIVKVFYRHGYSLLDAEEILKSAGIEIILVK